MVILDKETAIKLRMQRIRIQLDQMAIKRGDLEHEYRELNKELGRIELLQIETTKPTTAA